MRTITIVQGDLVRYHGVRYSVLACPPSCVEFILSSDSDTCHLSLDAFNEARRNGDIEILKDKTNQLDTINLKSFHLSPSLAPIYREMLASRTGQSAKKVIKAIARASKNSVFGKLVDAGDIVIPSVRTLLRHMKKLELLEQGLKPAPKNVKPGFKPELTSFYHESIEALYCDKNCLSKNAVHGKLEELCKSKGFPLPSKSYIRNVIAQLHPVDVMVAREGYLRAQRYYHDYCQWQLPNFPLASIEMDAIHINGLIKFHGVVYHKLVMCVAIDVFSRCVCGISFTLFKNTSSGEVSTSSTECLCSVINHKAQIDGLETPWLCMGLPLQLTVDPGAANNNVNLQITVEMLSITLSITPTEYPQMKPFIERFFRTLRGLLGYLLPGYSHNGKTRGHDVCTVLTDKPAEFDDVRALIFYIIFEQYHNKPHRGLGGKTPLEVWRGTNPELIRQVADHDSCEIIRGSVENGTIQKTVGIQHFNQTYSSKELLVLRGYLQQLQPKKPPMVQFRFNVLDISKIVVLVPEIARELIGKHYLLVPSTAGHPVNTHLAEVVSIEKLDSVLVPLYSSVPKSVDTVVARLQSLHSSKTTSNRGAPILGIAASDVSKAVEQFKADVKNHLQHRAEQAADAPDDDLKPFDGVDDE